MVSYVIRLATESEITSRADAADVITLFHRTMAGKKPGKYLEWSDPDARDGLGAERWTDDVGKALKFESFIAAHNCWTAQSTVRPLRPDGKPNKPMTAYSVSIEILK